MTTSIHAGKVIPDKGVLEQCLEKVIASQVFSKSARQKDLLLYLVHQSVNGHADRLKGYVIGVEVFGRGSDFDPAVDAIVRVEVGRLRTKLREYYENEGASDTLEIMLPKGGYAVEFFERTALESPAQSPSQRKIRSNIFDDTPSLAVLPLANLCVEDGLDYFVDGITDSLIFELSRLSGLFVISRQSSFAYRASALSSETIAADLGVRYLLEGSVQRAESNVRVRVQLIDASSGGHIWSERFDTTLKDIFSLQDEVTRSIVKVLQVKLAPAEAALFGHEGTSCIEAHDALLRGLECHWKYSPRSIADARQYFTQAVHHDPNYAAAHAWLARSLIHQWIMKWDIDRHLRELALMHAEKAVMLDEQLPYAWAVQGWVLLWLKQREPAIAACRRAVSMNPNNPESLNFLSMALSSAGFGEEALYYVVKARRINPHSSPFYEFVLGMAYYVLEDYDKAISAFQHGAELSGSFIPNHVYLCTTYALLERHDKMRMAREQVLALVGGDLERMIEPPWVDEKLAAFYKHLLNLAGLGTIPGQ